MNIAEAKQQVKDTVEAYLARDEAGFHRIAPARQRPVFLVGAPGIGKTAIMAQVAQEMGVGLVTYSMTHHTRQSALGLPSIVHRSYGKTEYDASEYTMSEIIASVYEFMEETGLEKGILFLDEINCVSETLYPSMLQFLQFKTFGKHGVPEDWIVACAGNPPEYNKSVHEFDIVTLDRLRKIEVEPDYAAWKSYAQDKGIHPAISSFLEAKQDCFYSVETTPSGKSFVTARGWDDLSEIMTLFEDLGKDIDKSLIVQFLQNEDIAERFAIYYDLFNKYRSDYQIDRILAGSVEPDIVERARKAPFDERLAVLELILSALGSGMGEALQREDVLVRVRDALRAAKESVLAGGEVSDVLGQAISSREDKLERALEAKTLPAPEAKRERLAISLLKRASAACQAGDVMQGADAFSPAEALYSVETDAFDQMVEKVEAQLDHAFRFVEDAFGDDREMLVFVTELTAARASSQFINRFGNETYFAHNEGLMVDRKRKALFERIDEMDLGGQPAHQQETH